MASYNVKDQMRGLTKEELDAELRQFAKYFPKKRLLALQLNGFSHRILFDDSPRTEDEYHAVEISFCMGEAEELAYCDSDEQREQVKAGRAFLKAIGYNNHAYYQGNPTEVIYVEPEEREAIKR